MIILKFFITKYKTFKELSSDEKELTYYKDLYKNEIIWIDGLVLNNVYISNNNKDIVFNNNSRGIKNKLNIVGVTYIIKKYEDNVNENEYNSEV